jgi:hypothetical protein
VSQKDERRKMKDEIKTMSKSRFEKSGALRLQVPGNDLACRGKTTPLAPGDDTAAGPNASQAGQLLATEIGLPANRNSIRAVEIVRLAKAVA